MIQRRVADALRKQDWFTVVIEFVLVVAGVLVALQFDNWNEDRQDRLDEIYYLGRILADIDDSIASNNATIDYLDRKAESSSWVVGKLRDASLEQDEEPQFKERFLEIGDWRTGDFIDSTLQELRSSGRMHIIRSRALRERLGRFELRLESHRRARDNLGDFQKALELEIMARIDRFNVDGKETLISSFDELTEDKVLIRYLDRHALFYAARLGNVRELQGYLDELRQHTQQALQAVTK